MAKQQSSNKGGNLKNVWVPYEWSCIMQERFYRNANPTIEARFVEEFGMDHDAYKERYTSNGASWPEHFRNLLQEWFDLPDVEQDTGGELEYESIRVTLPNRQVKRLMKVGSVLKSSPNALVATWLDDYLDSAFFRHLESVTNEELKRRDK